MQNRCGEPPGEFAYPRLEAKKPSPWGRGTAKRWMRAVRRTGAENPRANTYTPGQKPKSLLLQEKARGFDFQGIRSSVALWPVGFRAAGVAAPTGIQASLCEFARVLGSVSLCRPHSPLRRSPFSKEKVGVLNFRLYEFARGFLSRKSVPPSSVSALAEPASLFMV